MARKRQVRDEIYIAGTSGDDYLVGTPDPDTIDAGDGSDTLIGKDGADTLIGGLGNDFYRVEIAADIIIENVGEGFDSLYAVRNYVLAAGVEIELMSPTDPAAPTPLDLTGNEFGQTIIGTAGVNTLIGNGGADILAGGAGNDFYRVEQEQDVIIEYAGEGFDSVYAEVHYKLGEGWEIELLSAVGPSLAGPLNLTGNAYAQTIIGTAGANVLIGGGGGDVLSGGAGADHYRIENSLDVVIESAGGGNDWIWVALALGGYTLPEGAEIENVYAIDPESAGGMHFVGNGFGNAIFGTRGNDVLEGGGGRDTLYGGDGDDILLAGGGSGDRLEGGAGNDVYRVETANQRIVDTSGFDAVYVALAVGEYNMSNFSLGVDLLSAIDPQSTVTLDLIGDHGAQTIIGTAGANRIWGERGNDTFTFVAPLGPNNIDRIEDFSNSSNEHDRIALDDAVFTGLPLGQLGANAFVVGTSAQDADDRIIYDFPTGRLFFDADGNGAGAAIQFAVVRGGRQDIPIHTFPIMVASDFEVI